MKNLFLSFIVFIFSNTLSAQDWGSINFEDPFASYILRIGEPTHTNTLWQVGKPNKINFTSAYSIPNVIVTDTSNSYPINDTSIFILSNRAGEGLAYGATDQISGAYYVNSDTLTDYGRIEFSPDNGTTWIDMLNDTLLTNSWSSLERPVLSGNSAGWKTFGCMLSDLSTSYIIHPFDTVLLKFTFISDGIETNKDGLMFDDFYWYDFYEGVPENQKNDLISIYPNPSSGLIHIQKKNSNKCRNSKVEIFDSFGKLLLTYINPTQDILIDNPSGLYFIKYSSDQNYTIKKLIISK